jgi:hypothetical protein
MNPSDPIRLALIGTTSLRAPTCDPAINLDAPGVSALLSAYEHSRSDTDRDALPLHPGATLSTFTLAPLTSAAFRFVMGGVGVERAQRAVLACCHNYADERGAEHRAQDHGGVTATPGAKGFSIANEEWLEHLASTFGHAAVEEIAAVAITRAEVGARAVAPFALPRGLMLAR